MWIRLEKRGELSRTGGGNGPDRGGKEADRGGNGSDRYLFVLSGLYHS